MSHYMNKMRSERSPVSFGTRSYGDVSKTLYIPKNLVSWEDATNYQLNPFTDVLVIKSAPAPVPVSASITHIPVCTTELVRYKEKKVISSSPLNREVQSAAKEEDIPRPNATEARPLPRPTARKAHTYNNLRQRPVGNVKGLADDFSTKAKEINLKHKTSENVLPLNNNKPSSSPVNTVVINYSWPTSSRGLQFKTKNSDGPRVIRGCVSQDCASLDIAPKLTSLDHWSSMINAKLNSMQALFDEEMRSQQD